MSNLTEREKPKIARIGRRPFIALLTGALAAPRFLDSSTATAAALSDENDPLAEVMEGIPALVFLTDDQKVDGGYLGKDAATESVGTEMFRKVAASAILAGGDLKEDANWFISNHAGNPNLAVAHPKLASSLDWRAPTAASIQGVIDGRPYEHNGETVNVRPNPGFHQVQNNPLWHVYNLAEDPQSGQIKIEHSIYLNAARADFYPYSENVLYQLALFRARIEEVHAEAVSGIEQGKTTLTSFREYISSQKTQLQLNARAQLTALKRLGQLEEAKADSPHPWTISDNLKNRLTQVNEALTTGGDPRAIEVLTSS